MMPYLHPCRAHAGSGHAFIILFYLNLRLHTYSISVKKLILFLSIFIISAPLFAQDSTSRGNSRSDRKAAKRERINAIIKSEEEGTIVFRRQRSLGIQLRTNGYGAFYELGRRRSPRFANTYSIEITEIKHPKEEKLDGIQNIFSNSFIYGKLNNFYQLKLGFGQQYIFGQKGNKNGVAVIGMLQGGFNMGFMKPYYLHLEDASGKERTINYYEDSTTFLNPVKIFGGGGIGKGWDQLKLSPGAYLKAALRFDFGRYNESIQALEIGMSLDAYSKKIEMMAFSEPERLFFQGHIAFVFGSRKK
jgi:hypothetical protein